MLHKSSKSINQSGFCETLACCWVAWKRDDPFNSKSSSSEYESGVPNLEGSTSKYLNDHLRILQSHISQSSFAIRENTNCSHQKLLCIVWSSSSSVDWIVKLQTQRIQNWRIRGPKWWLSSCMFDQEKEHNQEAVINISLFKQSAILRP